MRVSWLASTQHTPQGGGKVPICAVARLAKGQLKKLSGSKPGMAILEFSVAGVYIVDEFR